MFVLQTAIIQIIGFFRIGAKTSVSCIVLFYPLLQAFVFVLPLSSLSLKESARPMRYYRFYAPPEAGWRLLLTSDQGKETY